MNQPPVAVPGADVLSGEAPLTVAFDALGSSDDNGIVSYFWDFKDGGTSNLADPTNTFTTAGDYDVELTVTDGGGLSDTASITVQVFEPNEVVLVGEQKKWHRLTIFFNGIFTSEEEVTNPFLDYRLNVTFTSPSGNTFEVPGFYAADGNAAETSATSGNKWAVRFTPNETGQWDYLASFRSGPNIAISLDDTEGTGLAFNGASGNFMIEPNDKAFPDNRANGRLNYVGERYLKFEETQDYFIKVGADSPENLLAYSDFDNTIGSKDWSPHIQDFQVGDPTWQNGKGEGIIGAINYLSASGMNAFSFLTMNISGDGRDVWPWTESNNDDFDGASQAESDNRLRYDVSKLEQWEILFEHAESKGMFLHFKTQEQENDQLLDGGELGTERKLYYRELIARFGHHLALNWNVGEENTQTTNQRIEMAQYIGNLDAYGHHIVVHTFSTSQEGIYRPLLGNQSGYSGASIQSEINGIHTEIKKWVEDSKSAGYSWAVANDEQGPFNIGVAADEDYVGNKGTEADNRYEVRHKALWGTLMAGGYGVEYYFGYSTGETDLTAQDFRSRQTKWNDALVAKNFFRQHVPFTEMENRDDLVSNEGYCLIRENDIYLVYMPSISNPATIDLASAEGKYTVNWYNPITGGSLIQTNLVNVNAGQIVELGNPPEDDSTDWVILLNRNDGAPTAVVNANIMFGSAPLQVSFSATGSSDDVGIIDYLWDFGDGSTSTEISPQHTFTQIGEFEVTLTVTDEDGFKDIATISISVTEPLQWTDNDDIEDYSARHECSFVQAGIHFFLLGGRETADVDVFDYSTNTWSPGVNVAPVLFNHFQGVEYGGLIWVVTAIKDNNYPTDVPEDHIWAYDPFTNEWIQGPEIPQGRKRGSAGAVAYNDKFYIVAGSTNGHDGGYVPWFDEYDPATGTWRELPDAPRARDHFHAAIIGNKLYAVGGRLSGGDGGVFQPYVPEVDVYDFTTESWDTLPENSDIMTPRASAQVAVFNGRLLVIGGSVEDQVIDGELTTGALDIVEEFDPTTGNWDRLSNTVHVRRATQAIVSGNGIFMASGSDVLSGGYQKNMEYYGEKSPVGTPLVGSTISVPSNIFIAPGSQTDIVIEVSGGNVGTMITSMELSGPDAEEFQIVSGELSHGFLLPESSHAVAVGFTGSEIGKMATLTIGHGASGELIVELVSGNPGQPSADAGPDVSVALPTDTVVLSGGGTDPDGGDMASYLWEQREGPNTAGLEGADTEELTVSGLIEGSYVFRLTVTDDEGDTAFDEASVTVLPEGQSNVVWLEAECATVGADWSVVDDNGASNGQYLLPPAGTSYSSAPSDPDGWVSFSFTLTSGGTYAVWGLVDAPTSDDNSFWVRANGGTWVKWNDIPGGNGFAWQQVWDNDNGNALVDFDLVAGTNTLDIALREDGTALDKIYVGDLQGAPTGQGEQAENCIFVPLPPSADAGPDVSVALPTDTVVLSGGGTDPDGGDITSYLWEQREGPNTAGLEGADTEELTVSGLIEGSYVFRLTVTDDEGDTAFDEASVTVLPEGQSNVVWLEAECATVGADWSVVDDNGASNGQYLLPPAGTSYSSAPSDPDGWVSFSFTLTSGGTYAVWGLVDAPNGSDDSFWVRANGGTWVKWNDIPGGNGFAWQQVWDNDNGNALVDFDLVAGTNTLDIALREDGTALDKIYVGDLQGAPTGQGEQAENCIFVPLPPSADAGPDVSVALPTDTVVLSGGGTDPDGGDMASYLWEQREGPNTAGLEGADTEELTVSGLIEGSYVFRLTVTDDEGDTAFDEASVTVLPEGQSNVIWLEAECATVGADWSVVDDNGASNGQYLLPPAGTSYSSAPSDPDGWVSFSFTLTSGGTYAVWGLVDAPTSDDNSFWVRANGGTWVKWNDIPGGNGFAWQQVWDNDNGNALVDFDLVAGTNTLDIALREDGTALDKIYVGDLQGAPTGQGDDDLGCTQTFLTANYSTFDATSKSDNIAIKLFPNPTKQEVILDISGSEKNSIKQLDLYDIQGRLIREYSKETIETNKIDVSGLKTGLYIIYIINGNGTSVMLKNKLVIR